MAYTYEQVFTKNDVLLNELIAEEIMEEPKPTNIPDMSTISHSIYSERGWWICVPQFETNTCDWHPVHFCGNFRLAWQAVKQLRSYGTQTQKSLLKHLLETFSPFDEGTEKDIARKLCRAVLLAKLEKLPGQS